PGAYGSRAPCTHDRDLRRRPREIDVRAQLLRAHDAVRAAIGLAGDEGDEGDRRLAVRVDELRAAADDAAVLLVRAGQEAGDVDEREDGQVERVAQAHEAGRLLRGVDVECAGQLEGLVR